MCCVALLSAIVGCTKQPAPDTRAEDERVIRGLEIEGWKTIEAKNLEGLISYFAEDALALYANNPILIGKDAIRESWRTSLARPGFAMSGQPVRVVVSRGGDLAYVQGTYSLTVNNALGQPATDKGKYVVIYKKQPDGQWKLAVDTGNSDLPLPDTSATSSATQKK
jgi:ketosteroid isomerase-like protein